MPLIVFEQDLVQLWPERDKARFAELALSHLHQALRQIYVRPIQTNQLAHTQPCAVQHQQHEMQRSRLKTRWPVENVWRLATGGTAPP